MTRTAAPVQPKPSVYPSTNVPDTTYVPPCDQNIGALPNILAAKKNGPAYKTTVPIYDEKIASEVYNHAMLTQVMLTKRKLLLLVSEVQFQVRKATLVRQAPAKDPIQVWTLYQDAKIPYVINNINPPMLTVFSFAHVIHQPETPPPGSLVVPNFYKQYLSLLSPSQVPQPLVVAKESSALRSIIYLVNYQ